MLKFIGAILIIGGAGGFGISKGCGYLRQVRQLREFSAALEILKCEMNYTLLPLSKLCEVTAKRSRGVCAQFFLNFSSFLDSGTPRARAASRAMNETRGLCLPSDAKLALLELCEALGRYDLDGENRLLQLAMHRLNAALARTETEKKPLVRSYAALGISVGVALTILMA